MAPLPHPPKYDLAQTGRQDALGFVRPCFSGFKPSSYRYLRSSMAVIQDLNLDLFTNITIQMKTAGNATMS